MPGKKVVTIKTAKGERKIGPGQPIFIIAEMSGNHNMKKGNAFAIIKAAAESGADAIKLQTYTPDTLTIDCDNEYFQVKVNDAWTGNTLYGLYKTAHTPWKWHQELKEYAEGLGLFFFSTPYDTTAIDFLEELGVQMHKVASFEVGDIEFLRALGKTKKPVIVSRGLANEAEIELCVKTLKDSGCPEVIVLHCVSSYPAVPDQMNLRTIPDIAEKFDVISGLSDHSIDVDVPVAAVALGACVIEKHFIVSRNDKGTDSAFSLEPEEFSRMVKAVRTVEKALGKVTYAVGRKESENVIFKRSIFVVKDVKKGEEITRNNVRVIRPGNGLAPKHLHKALGKAFKEDMKRGTPLLWDNILA